MAKIRSEEGIVKEKNGKYSIRFYYKDYTGKTCRIKKSGFSTKKEAKSWRDNFKKSKEANLTMSFPSFIDAYFETVSGDVRASTLETKKHIVELHILPYFKNKKMDEISPLDIKKWQSEIKKKGFSDTYLRTINAQLSAIFNHAIKFYKLSVNPCRAAGLMGKCKSGNIAIWDQFQMEQFLEKVKDKPESYYAFLLMYWTGIRLGECLALNIDDLDFEEKKLTISKTFYRKNGEDVITAPKTDAGIRSIWLPDFLIESMQEYVNILYGRTNKDRLFYVSKGFLEKEIKRGAKLAGLDPIRCHDLRHSHVSLLIAQGVDIATISKRLGHNKISTTLDKYGHMFEENAKAVADKLDKLYAEED